MLRAVLEGICFHQRWMLECEERKTKTDPVIRFVGGGETVTVMHLMHTLMRQGCVSGADLEAPVGSIMTRECVSVGEGAHLGDMLELLRTRRINRIPVVDAGMRPVGIVSRTDIINAFGVVQ